MKCHCFIFWLWFEKWSFDNVLIIREPLKASISLFYIFQQVTARRLWKKVYDELGGSPGSTSAATCTRKHYEKWGLILFQTASDLPITRYIITKTSVLRLVLPFERHMKGEDDRPLPTSKPRKPYKRNLDGKVQKAEKKRKRTNSDREMDSDVSRLISTSTRTKTVC